MMIDSEREPYDRERAIALLSYGDCFLTKELANEIADDMRNLTAEVTSLRAEKDSGRINRGDECPECGSDNTVRLVLSSGEQECQPCGHVFVTGKVSGD